MSYALVRSSEMIQSGNFDLSGMLAALGGKAKAMVARRIVFDSVDALLESQNPAAARREVYRLQEWLLQTQLTALITSKVFAGERATRRFGVPPLGGERVT